MVTTLRGRIVRKERVRLFSLFASLTPAALAVAACFSGEVALANPKGGAVVHGAATISSPAAGILNVQTLTPQTIINWGSFSISVGELTRFIQPSALSAILNRVAPGANPSNILGTLESRIGSDTGAIGGRVFLLNPNGIVFGSGSQINVGGLVASTLNLSNDDFLNNRMRFTDGAGAGGVVNHGSITGGGVHLIGNAVTNNGLITSPGGEVVLAAGNSVELVNPGTPNLRVEIVAPDNEARNLGTITAEAGRIGIYAGLINNSSTLRADSAVVEGGRIVLKATKNSTLEAGSQILASGTIGGTVEIQSGDTTLVSGTIAAQGATGAGGTVHVLGNKVGLIDAAHIDASGDTGGGTVLIGGDYQGMSPEVQNAFRTYVGQDATIKADAVTQGDGGKVIVWADDTTRVYGGISARGGALSGNGGFVETSGKVGLEVTRAPDVRAPQGLGGTWLLDPNDLEIVAGSEITNNIAQPFFSTLGETSRIGANLINLQLDFGSNVILTTTSQGLAAGAQQGNITISAPIVKTATGVGTTSLTMQAHNNIVIGPGGSITSTGDRLGVTLTANSDFSGGGGVTVGGGGIVTNGGSINISGQDLTAINAVIDARRTIGTGSGGSVSLSSNANMVNVGANILSGSFIQASGSTGVNINAPVTSGSSMFLSSSSGTVNVVAPVMSGTSFSASGSTGVNINATVNSGSSISLDSSSGPINVNSPMSGGFLDVYAGGADSVFTVTAPVTVAGAELYADNMDIQAMINAGGGLVSVQPTTFGRPMDLGTNTAGSLSLTQAELDNLATSGPKSFGGFSAGAITVSAPITVGSSSVSIDANTSFTVDAGASFTTAVQLDVNAPTITLDGTVNAQRVVFGTDTINVNALVTSATDIEIFTQSYLRPVNLGVVSDGPSSLDFTSAELNNLVTGATNPLRIGSTSSGALTVQGPIAPTGTQVLVLASGDSMGQAAGATITIPNLAFDVYGDVNLPEANVVGTLAASLCCSGNTFTFSNAVPLTIGTVGGISGVYNVNSFGATPTSATIVADNLDVASYMQFDSVTITPRNPATVRLDLGGADATGVLGISAADLANIYAGTLTLQADQADISAPVVSSSSVLAIAPVTAGRALNVIAELPVPKNVANLEFRPSEILNVSADSFILGDVNTGPVSVNAAMTAPGSINRFGLRSGDTATGITVNSALGATNNLSLTADVMTFNAAVSAAGFGGIAITTNTSGRPIDLGTKTGGTLGLDASELGMITASSGPLHVGDESAGDLTVSAPVVFSTIGDLHLTTNGVLHINETVTNTSAGVIHFKADAMNVNDSVTGGGDINLTTLNPVTSIALGTKPGGQLGLTTAELDFFYPGSGTLRIGDLDSSKSFNIQVTAPIAPAGATTLSLQTANGSVSQTTSAFVTVPNLAVRAGNAITFGEVNDIGTVALRSANSYVSIQHGGASPLTVGTVDGLSGVQASSSFAEITSNELNIDSFIEGQQVYIVSYGPMSLGTKPGGTLGLTDAELGNVYATTLTLGDSAITASNVTVTAPITGSSFDNLVIANAPGFAINVNSALTVPGNLTLTTSTLNVAAPVSSSFGQIVATADSMTFSAGPATVSSGSQIVLAPRNGTTVMNLGGPDVVSTTNTLGLDSTDLAALSTPFVYFGNGTPPSITVSTPTNLGATSAILNTSIGGVINVNAPLATTGDLWLTADDIAIAGAVSGANVTLGTVNTSRTVDLGTLGSGTFLGLDTASIMLISASNRLTFVGGTIIVSNPVTVTVPALTLQADTLNVNGTLTAPGDVTLLANTMDIANTVSSTGGGMIVAAPSGFTSMTLGPTTGSGLVLSSTEINQFSTSGALHLGDFMSTTSISVAAPINPGSVGALTLVANNGISQTAGSTISTGNLGLQSFSTVTLTEANNVGIVAGFGGNFSFTNNGLLSIGSVDGQSGISGSNVTLKGDTIAINQAVSGSTVTLAPRVAGAAINVGSKPGGIFGVSDAEIDMISASTLNIGQTTSGSVTVSAPVDRGSGNFNLVAQPGSTINVNATFASPNSNVGMNAGAGGTINIGAQVTAFSNITLTADNLNIAAPLVTTGSSVTLQPGTSGLPVNVGTETAGALSLTAVELALIDTDVLTIGNSSAGPLTVSAPFTSATLDQLRLISGGAIIQSPGAVITLSDPAGGALQLTSSSGGVSLIEANSVSGFLSGSASGSGSDFAFNNVLPMKLQNISVSAADKVLISGGIAGALPPMFLEVSIEVPTDQTSIAFNIIRDLNDLGESSNQAKRDEEEKKKETQSCR